MACLRLALLYICLITACTSKPDHAEKSVFQLNLSSGALESLDPAYAKDLYTMWTCHMLYNTLVDCDSNLQLRPSLAKSWEVSPDGLTYTFRIRENVLFHDNPAFPAGKGRLLTARDVVYSFHRLTDPATASSGAWIFNDRVDSFRPFEAPDDSTFILRLSAPFAPLPVMLSMPYCSIVPHEVVSHWGKTFRNHPCGTGPFQFKLWEEGNTLILHRNPRYWEQDQSGKALPYLDAVQLSFIDNKATEFLLFLQGKLHFVNGLDGSFKDLVLYKNGEMKPDFAKRYRLSKSTYLNTEYIGFLTDSTRPFMQGSPLNNVLIRQAMNYAIDRRRIALYFRNGIGIPATGGFIPAGMPGHEKEAGFGYTYQPQKAKTLLAAAGFPDGKGLSPVTITTPDNWADIVNFIATQLSDVGIPCRVAIMQPNLLRQQMSSSGVAAFRGQWIADYPDAETFLAVFYGQMPAPPNYTRFHNRLYDQWYSQSMSLPDSARIRMYRNMDSLAMSFAPLMPLFYDQLLHFTQQNVSGFSSNPMNLIDLKGVILK